MRFPGYIGIARVAPLAVVFLLCFGAFLHPYQLTQFVTGMVSSTAPTTQHSFHADAGTPGHESALAGNYMTATLDETETENQRPVNAEYLTALVLAVFFGVLLSVLGVRRSWHRQRILLLHKRRKPPATASPTRELAPQLLSVFLL